MDRAVIDVSSLGGDLDAPARRRLWFLGQVIQGCGLADVESALAGAKLLEDFVVSGRRIALAGTVGDIHKSASDMLGAPARVALQERTDAPGESAEQPRARGLLLDDNTRERFIAEAVRNPDNRHLAVMFGLSVRQAHAVRVAFRHMIAAAQAVFKDAIGERDESEPAAGPESARAPLPRIGAASHVFKAQRVSQVVRAEAPRAGRPPARQAKGAKRVAEMDRETELRLQSEFLAQKPSPTHTMEDVVRFLRQQGDVVLMEGAYYRVNYAQRFDQEELVARANNKRASRGLAPFVIPRPPLPPNSADQTVPARATA